MRLQVENRAESGTLQGLVERLTQRRDDPALVSVGPNGAVTLTYANLKERAERIRDDLLGLKIAPGEPIAIFAPNGAAWVTACLGVLASGAAVMPLDFRGSETERESLIASSGCRHLYASENGASSTLSLRSCRKGLERERRAMQPIAEPDDAALLLHTSGTTATPKAVVLSHANVLSNIDALIDEDLIGRHDRALLPLPLHHVYPLVVGLLLPLSVGATVVLPSGISGPEIVAALRAGEANMLVGVPRLYDALLNAIVDSARARGRAETWIFEQLLQISIALARCGRRSFGGFVFRNLRRQVAPALWRLASGGAALDRKTEESLLGLGYEVLVGYGLTETSPIVTFNRSGHARIGTAGRPLPGARLRIANPDARDVGEIEVQGPNVFAGYRDDTTHAEAAFTPDGWFRTGDLGRIDEDGYLEVLGRVGEALVLPGGEKLNPEDLERHYEASPVIGEIGVLIEQGKLVGLVVASSSLRERSLERREAEARSALTASARSLPTYMQLSGFALVEGPLPRTPLGKLRRYLLPTLYHTARAGEMAATKQAEPSAEDRRLLEDRTGQRVWRWLAARFPGRQLSLQMGLQLDLGIDSLDSVTMTMDLEREFGIALDEAALANVVTVRDLIVAAIAANAKPHLAVTTVWLSDTGPLGNAIWCAGVTAIRAVVNAVFRLHVEGVEHLPLRGAYVLCPNHASYLDGPVLATVLPWAMLRRVCWVGGIDVMFSTAPRRTFSRLAHVLPIDRTAHASRAGLELTAEALRRDRIVVWFPEGSLTKDGTLQPFLPGIGSLVRKVPVPIVPVSIEGTFQMWLPQHRFPRPGRVSIRFGPQLNPSHWAKAGTQEQHDASVAIAVKAAIIALRG